MNRKEIEDKISSGKYTKGDVGIKGCTYTGQLYIPLTDIRKTPNDDSLYGSSNGARVKDTVAQQVAYYKDMLSTNRMDPTEKLPTVKKMDRPIEVDGEMKSWQLVDGYHKTIAAESLGMGGLAYDVYSFDDEVRESVFQQAMNCKPKTQKSTPDDILKNVTNLIKKGLVEEKPTAVEQIVGEMSPFEHSSVKQKIVSAILYESEIPTDFESLTYDIAEKWYKKVGLAPAGGKIDPKTRMRVVTCKEGYETRRIIDAIAAYYEQEGTKTLFRCYVHPPGKTQNVRDKRKKMLATIKRYSDAQANVGTTIFPFEVEGFIPQQKDGVDRDDFKRLIPVSEII